MQAHPGFFISNDEFPPGLLHKVDLDVDLSLVDGKVLDVALLKHRVYARPGVGVQLAAIGGFIGFEAGDPGVALRRLVRGATGEQGGEKKAEHGFHGELFVWF